jgi:hypothetical protein
MLDAYLDSSTYDRFKAYLAEHQLTESTALINVLERAMTNFWPLEFKQLKQSYSLLDKFYREYSRDQDVLSALEQQNETMKRLLDERGQQKKLSPTKT